MTTYGSDTFNRADNSSSLGSLDGGTLNGTAWTATTANLGINGNKAYSTSNTSSVGYVDTSQADVDVQATFSGMSTSGTLGIVVRFTDASNYIILLGRTNAFQLNKIVSGSSTTLASGSSLSNGDTIRLVANGNNFDCYQNGSLAFSATDSFNNTATKHGFRFSGNTSQRLDDWSASSISAQNIDATLLDGSPSLFAPRVDPQDILANLLTNSPSLFQPAVTGGGQTVNANQLNAAPTLFQPSVSLALAISVPILSAAPTFTSPSVGQVTTATGATVPSYVVKVRDLDGTNPTTLASALPEEITWTLNEPTEAVISWPKRAYTTSQIPTLATASTVKELLVLFDDDLLFKGPMFQPSANGSDGAVTAHCMDRLALLYRRNIDAPRDNYLTDGSFETSGLPNWPLSGSATASRSSTRKQLGTYSLKLENITDPGAHVSQSFSAGPNGVGLLLTCSGWFFIEQMTAPAFGNIGIMLEGFQNGVRRDYNFRWLDTAEPTGVWTRFEFTIWIPPNERWDMVCSIYAPLGTMYVDALQVVDMASSGASNISGNATEEADIARIMRALTTAVQDSSLGKSSLHVGTNMANTGVTLFRVYFHSEHIAYEDAIGEFIQRDDGVDISLLDTETTTTLRTHYPKRGTDRSGSVTLTFGSEIADYRFSRDGGGAITRATVMGQGDGPDREEGEYADTSALGGLVLQEVRQANPEATINSLLPTARERVRNHKRPPLVLEIDLKPSQVALVHTVKEGDYITVVIDDGYVQVSGKHRVVKRKLACRTRVLTLYVNEDL